MKEKHGANMAVMVDAQPSLKGGEAGVSEGVVMSRVGDGKASVFVNDIKRSDLQTPTTTNIINEVKTGQQLYISSKRYIYSLDLLKEVLTVPSVFHWTMEVDGPRANIVLDMGDLATHSSANCVAFRNRSQAKLFVSHEDVESLLSSINVLGTSVVTSYTSARQARNWSAGPRTGIREAYGVSFTVANEADQVQPSPGGQRIVMLVADNSATQMAVQLVLSFVRPTKDLVHFVMMVLVLSFVRPTKDLVHFVMVVRSEVYVADAMETCQRFEALAKSALALTHCTVLMKGTTPLTEQLEEFTTHVKSDLVVMGSQSLAEGPHVKSDLVVMGSQSLAEGPHVKSDLVVMGSQSLAEGPHVKSNLVVMGSQSLAKQGTMAFSIGSITLSMLRTFSTPLLVVKADARNAQIDWGKDKLKCLLQESPVSMRLLENFRDIASSHHFEAQKQPMNSPFESDGVKVADLERAHIIAVPAPQGRTVPESILRLLKNSRSAVMIYRNNANTSGGVGRESALF
eukprot:gene18527-25034_t